MSKLSHPRIVSLTLIVLITAVFLYLKVIPFGQVTYNRDYSSWFRSGKGFIRGFTPAERIDSASDRFPRLLGDPVYFSVFTPRTFDRAKVTITYRDNLSSSTPIIEAGLLVDKLVWRYDLKPLQNKILDRLMFDWSRSEEDGAMFLQKEKAYVSLTDFKEDLAAGRLKNCPGGPTTCVASYNYPLDFNFHLADYQKSQPVTIDKPLRGPHQFYLYLGREPLRLDFGFVILNQDKGADPVTVNLYSQDKLLASKFLVDDGPIDTSGQQEKKGLTLGPLSLSPGVYKVEVKVSEDTVIKQISSSVDRLSFIGKIWPVSTAAPLSLYTDADYLQAKALSPASLGVINFAGQDFSLARAYEQFIFRTTSGLATKKINLAKDDIILENSGVFAWEPTSLFNPSLKRVDRFFPTDDIAYIVAGYEPPRSREDGFQEATAEFTLKGAYREKGLYSFMISIPGLRADDGEAGYVEIKEIKIELNGRTLWQKISGR